MEKGAIFPLFYLPPIEYFSKLIDNKDNIIIENAEHFQKQTYRNRASIHSPNGKLDLVVPILKGSKNHTKVKDVKISYDFNWQRLHLMSLQTSYRSSAYFEFYEDDFAIFYEKKWDYLYDYNEQLLSLFIKFLKLKIQYKYSNKFENEYLELNDFRNNIHPKRNGRNNVKTYFQVFEERNGFLPNLSIVDLLFNQGPQSTKYL
jgi:hypothetical protein